jgi:hypothetical protein
MVVSKYNWAKIKQDYFNSQTLEVKDFLSTYVPIVNYNGMARKATTGWRSEKEEYKTKMATKAIETVSVERLNAYAETYLETKQKILKTIQKRVDKKGDDLPMIELKQAWDIFKVELGEPSTITKAEVKSTVSFEDFLDQIPKPND